MTARPLHIRNARVWWHDGQAARLETRDLYTSSVVLAQPASGALVVDLRGFTLFPGLINAHDHLELNHYPRTKFRDCYNNAHQWGEDVNARLNDPPFRDLRSYPLADRLFIGGLKNLLCGATTVAHHNPPHKPLFRRDFPVRVLARYGWAHSLHFADETAIRAAYRNTPPDAPFFIHLAEGTDATAAGEYERLKALGCISKQTVLIHGVGFPPADISHAASRIGGLVICPTTNRYLLGATADVDAWQAVGGCVALGSDSRLTADGDLLDEMRALARTPARILAMVTTDAARLLRLPSCGVLSLDAPADFIAIHSTTDDLAALCQSRRADLALVVKGGVPQLGDPDLMALFPHVETVPALLDDVPKAIHAGLARRLMACTLSEPGLTVQRRAVSFPLARLWRRKAE